MPFNGSGVYNLPNTTVTPAVTDTTIDDADFNVFTADLAAALTLCITKDGQTSSPTLTAPIIEKIHDANGNEVLDFGPTASAVNNIKLNNATTTNRPTIASAGEVDIGINFTNKEAEPFLVLDSVSAAANYVKVTNAATGNRPTIATAGEVNIGIDFENSEGEELLELVATASAVNNVVITNAATGDASTISTSETNTDLAISGNGTGKVSIDGVYTKTIDIGDWNMDTTASKVVAHGLAAVDYSEIQSFNVVIRDDGGVNMLDLPYYAPAGTTNEGIELDASNVTLYRSTSGRFDSTFFDSTSYNRGWITIRYAA